MSNWEYLTFDGITGSALETYLNERGEEGWELVNYDSTDQYGFGGVFKRKKVDLCAQSTPGLYQRSAPSQQANFQEWQPSIGSLQFVASSQQPALAQQPESNPAPVGDFDRPIPSRITFDTAGIPSTINLVNGLADSPAPAGPFFVNIAPPLHPVDLRDVSQVVEPASVS